MASSSSLQHQQLWKKFLFSRNNVTALLASSPCSIQRRSTAAAFSSSSKKRIQQQQQQRRSQRAGALTKRGSDFLLHCLRTGKGLYIHSPTASGGGETSVSSSDGNNKIN